MKDVELLTFDESSFLLLSIGTFIRRRAAGLHCQPSICLFDQQHRNGNCVVCWAIVTHLDIAGKPCEVWCVCAFV